MVKDKFPTREEFENERLESALAWCKKNNIDLARLKKFNRESKKKNRKFFANTIGTKVPMDKKDKKDRI